MKMNFTRKKLFGVTLLGVFAAAPLALTASVQAAPPDRAPAYGRRNNDRRNDNRNNDNRNNDRRSGDWRSDADGNKGYDRDRYDSDREYRTRYDSDRNNNRSNSTFTGRVTNVRSDSSFDLKANNRTYNVYAVTRLPRRLNENDEVRVYGRLYGNNDIRNANVALINDRNNRNNDNRYGNNRNNDNRYNNRNDNNNGERYQTYTGTVTNVRNNREFDVRIGDTTYNVYASSDTRRLSDNDTVRVYGQRVGKNDIRNANVMVTRNR